MSRDHDVDIQHHHCVECGGLMTGASSIHPQCDIKASLEVELDAFRRREEERERKEAEEDDSGSKHGWLKRR